MGQYQVGDVVLLAMPAGDSNAARRRPALVLADTGDDQVIVAQITSFPVQGAFDVEVLAWQEAGLLVPSAIRVRVIATLERYLIERRLGGLAPSDLAQVRTALHRLWFEE
jgi:mRNA interferase MazF